METQSRHQDSSSKQNYYETPKSSCIRLEIDRAHSNWWQHLEYTRLYLPWSLRSARFLSGGSHEANCLCPETVYTFTPFNAVTRIPPGVAMMGDGAPLQPHKRTWIIKNNLCIGATNFTVQDSHDMESKQQTNLLTPNSHLTCEQCQALNLKPLHPFSYCLYLVINNNLSIMPQISQYKSQVTSHPNSNTLS